MRVLISMTARAHLLLLGAEHPEALDHPWEMQTTTFLPGSLVIVTAPHLLRTQVGVVIQHLWDRDRPCLLVLTPFTFGVIKAKHVTLA